MPGHLAAFRFGSASFSWANGQATRAMTLCRLFAAQPPVERSQAVLKSTAQFEVQGAQLTAGQGFTHGRAGSLMGWRPAISACV
ncbi:hypothetical protein CTI14_30860 [Methylobacterium radiotolerans]|nr:hypothetical protein CTI14_30860 [Methylobacterium radiotolerans]